MTKDKKSPDQNPVEGVISVEYLDPLSELHAITRSASQMLVKLQHLTDRSLEQIESQDYQGEDIQQALAIHRMYKDSLQATSTLISTALRYNIEDRAIRLQEAQVAGVARALEIALQTAGVTGEKRILAKQKLAHELQMLAVDKTLGVE